MVFDEINFDEDKLIKFSFLLIIHWMLSGVGYIHDIKSNLRFKRLIKFIHKYKYKISDKKLN